MTDYIATLLDSHKGGVHVNLSVAELMEHALRRNEGMMASNGAFVVRTGKYTGRSPEDKFIDSGIQTDGDVDWGKVNKPFDPIKFERLFARILAHLDDRDLYIFDGFAGADPAYRLPVRVITEKAWHSLFINRLLIRPSGVDNDVHPPRNAPLRADAPFTIIDVADFQAIPEIDGTRSETFIILDFDKRIGLIGGTEYAGEIKKSIFTVLNYLLPHQDVLPMHCSANIGKRGDTALFFGLSGTGKTTLSADPERNLIGDDEHGWSDQGVFNFEGGCYAKCIHLTPETEPEIWSAIRYGAVLENVVLDPHTREPNFDDGSLTENTRAAYPLDFIPGAVIPSVGGHPKNIIFLTADAFGVLPPVARLTTEQAMYYFLSGYTSKLAGTERGVTTPQPTFSACFGAPFMPLSPVRYAELLGQKLREHDVRCFLLNTGWTGGSYGTGRRIDLAVTRTLLTHVLAGSLNDVPYVTDQTFGLRIPTACAGIDPGLLLPRQTWSDPIEYDTAAARLAGQFIENFKAFSGVPDTVRFAGPHGK
jgi:phosphoenolpyruvate carboxykinase (ATP)